MFFFQSLFTFLLRIDFFLIIFQHQSWKLPPPDMRSDFEHGQTIYRGRRIEIDYLGPFCIQSRKGHKLNKLTFLMAPKTIR